MEYCFSQTTFKTSFALDPGYFFVSENISPACWLILLSITGIGCDVNDSQTKVPTLHLTTAVWFSKPFSQHTSTECLSHQTYASTELYCITHTYFVAHWSNVLLGFPTHDKPHHCLKVAKVTVYNLVVCVAHRAKTQWRMYTSCEA